MAVIFHDPNTFKKAILDIRSRIILGKKNSKFYFDTLSVMEGKINDCYKALKFPPMFFVMETEKNFLFVCAGLEDMPALHPIVYAVMVALCFRKEGNGLLPDWNKTLLIDNIAYQDASKQEWQVFTTKLANTIRQVARKNKIKDIKSMLSEK